MAMSLPLPKKPRIFVCFCTFKRPSLLRALLQALERQETEGLFDYSISIADNDFSGSGRPIVEEHALRTRLDIRYTIEPEQNISLARNKAIENSSGDFIALIDDDELPQTDWLLSLYKDLSFFETAGVLGPVFPRYESPPPRWVVRGRFYERPSYYSGHYLSWWLAQTSNCLLRRSLFEDRNDWFQPKFGSGGEDRDFFKRMIAKGNVFVWCNEAPVSESVPPERWAKRTLLKRALLRGKMTYLARKHDMRDILISSALLLIYSLGLPLLLILFPVFGFETFMKYLIKSADHLGKLLALFRIDVVKERYIV
jgi:succinoglycan biosynthesis protein ExoM